MTSSSAATPPASSTPIQTCARCGHQTGGCSRCGRNDALLGGRIGHKDLCHLDSTHEPTCYTKTSWELSEQPGGYIVALDEYLGRTSASGTPMDLIGKTVQWHHDGLFGPKRWFTALITGRNGDAYVGTVVNPGNYGRGLSVGDEANNLKAYLCTVIDSEPDTQDPECE